MLQWGSVDPKFQVEGVAPTNHSSQKTRINVLSYDIKIWTDLSSVLSQYTRVTDRQTDRQTDRILIARPRLHYMQRGKKLNTRKFDCVEDTVASASKTEH